MDHSTWITELFGAIDRRDAETFQKFLAKDVLFRFGNTEAVHGRETAGAVVDGFFHSIAGLSHDVHQILETPRTILSHGIVTYTRLDGSKLAVPFANVFNMIEQHFHEKDTLIAEYLIFADVSALYASA